MIVVVVAFSFPTMVFICFGRVMEIACTCIIAHISYEFQLLRDPGELLINISSMIMADGTIYICSMIIHAFSFLVDRICIYVQKLGNVSEYWYFPSFLSVRGP